eukprot:gene19499-biopygen8473
MPAPRPRHPSQKVVYSPRHARAMPAPRPRHCPVTPGAIPCLIRPGAVAGRGGHIPGRAGRILEWSVTLPDPRPRSGG